MRPQRIGGSGAAVANSGGRSTTASFARRASQGRFMDVTCIIATKNAEKHLPEALQSIRAQPGVEVDVIVVDGASTDRTREIAQSYGARVAKEDGPGLSHAWNTGIRLAKAPLIGFLDSDDIWVADTLADRVRTLEAAAAAVSIGRVRHFLDQADPSPGGFKRILQAGIEQLAPIPGAMLVRRSVFDEIGAFDPRYVLAADVDWLGRLINAAVATMEFARLVLLKRLHSANLTGQIDLVHRDLLAALRQKLVNDRRTRASKVPPARQGGA